MLLTQTLSKPFSHAIAVLGIGAVCTISSTTLYPDSVFAAESNPQTIQAQTPVSRSASDLVQPPIDCTVAPNLKPLLCRFQGGDTVPGLPALEIQLPATVKQVPGLPMDELKIQRDRIEFKVWQIQF
ncbi:hypothetical protein ACKFKG_22050 [Phormidesmis sp. 146-35]